MIKKMLIKQLFSYTICQLESRQGLMVLYFDQQQIYLNISS